jgi:hypothetical protein
LYGLRSGVRLGKGYGSDWRLRFVGVVFGSCLSLSVAYRLAQLLPHGDGEGYGNDVG